MDRKTNKKRLIMAADDFGYHPVVNEGIIFGAKKGVITSASVLIYGQAIHSVKNFSSNNPVFDLGLHLTYVRTDQDTSKKSVDAEELANHFLEQYNLFVRTFGKKPTNFSLHRATSATKLISSKNFSLEANVALKILEEKTNIFLRSKLVDYANTFIIKSSFIKGESCLLNIMTEMRPGLNLLVCHPAKKVKHNKLGKKLLSTYSLEKRSKELKLLTSKSLADNLKKEAIQLTDFKKG